MICLEEYNLMQKLLVCGYVYPQLIFRHKHIVPTQFALNWMWRAETSKGRFFHRKINFPLTLMGD